MRVLFVVKEYLPKPTPPGICVMNIQKALLDRNVQSDVLMVGDDEGLYGSGEFGDVFSIKSSVNFEKKKEGILNYLKIRLPMLFTWPIPSIKRVNDYKRMIGKLNAERGYDAIIGTLFPADVCVACSNFKHFFLYELDSLINNPVYKQGIKKYLALRLTQLEKKLFDSAELIIHLNHNERFYCKEKYNRYAEKSVFSGIPNLLEESTNDSQCVEEDLTELRNLSSEDIVMVYSGLLSNDYRSPSKLIEIVKEISKHIDVRCLFFSRGDCEDELRQAEIDTNGVIRRMGYVSQEVLDQYTQRADFLLDIGNRLSGEDYSLPSKVISYMATGKPIIHMNGINDSAIDYLKKYGLALNVDGELPINEIRAKTLDFIKNNKEKKVPFEMVKKMFPQNTPEYTADLIVKQIEKRRSGNK